MYGSLYTIYTSIKLFLKKSRHRGKNTMTHLVNCKQFSLTAMQKNTRGRKVVVEMAWDE